MKKLPEPGIKVLVTLLVVMMTVSCGQNRKTGNVEEVKSGEEISADILERAMIRGGEIASHAQAALSAKLKKEMKKGGPEQAIRFCNQNALPIIDSLRNQFRAEIRRVSFRTRNPADEPDPVEEKILQEYEMLIKNAETPDDRVRAIDDHTILFTRPIFVANPVCLKCHGVPGKDVASGTLDIIHSLYPDDRATGYSLSDLRGMWSIRLSGNDLLEEAETTE